jgi:hypothetical protein
MLRSVGVLVVNETGPPLFALHRWQEDETLL